MKEIEIKIQISDEQLVDLNVWLSENAEFVGEKHHIEYYINNPKSSFKYNHQAGYIDAKNYLRIRHTEKGDSVCLKVFEIDEKNDTSKNLAEYETQVENGEILQKLFNTLGYTEETIIDKTRKSYTYKDFEIEIDEVKNLGVFVEIEVKNHGDDDQIGFKKIKDLLREIDITSFKEQKRGYVSMIWNPDYNFGGIVELD